MTEYRITWTIEVDGGTPREAAHRVWRDYFILGDASVFEVTNLETGVTTLVDMMEEEEENENSS